MGLVEAVIGGGLMAVDPLPDIRDGILVERLVKTMRYVAEMRGCQYVVQRPGIGLLFALADPQIRIAITCIHGKPGYPWTLQETGRSPGHVPHRVCPEIQAAGWNHRNGISDAVANVACR